MCRQLNFRLSLSDIPDLCLMIDKCVTVVHLELLGRGRVLVLLKLTFDLYSPGCDLCQWLLVCPGTGHRMPCQPRPKHPHPSSWILPLHDSGRVLGHRSQVLWPSGRWRSRQSPCHLALILCTVLASEAPEVHLAVTAHMQGACTISSMSLDARFLSSLQVSCRKFSMYSWGWDTCRRMLDIFK